MARSNSLSNTEEMIKAMMQSEIKNDDNNVFNTSPIQSAISKYEYIIQQILEKCAESEDVHLLQQILLIMAESSICSTIFVNDNQIKQTTDVM